MSDSLESRYSALIDQIVQATLKGNIRSKEQVYQMLVDDVEAETGDVFEQVLQARVATTQQQAGDRSDELKQAKATRSLRALQTIQGEWGRWQERNKADEALTIGMREIVSAEPQSRLVALLRVLDPNRDRPLSLAQVQQLARQLRQFPAEGDLQAELQQLAQGIGQGLECWNRLQDHIVSWLYEQGRGTLGFGGVPGQQGPWFVWSKQVGRAVPQSFFQALAMEQSPVEWIERQPSLSSADLVELAIALRCLHQGLVNWFDKLIYDAKVGAKLSISTFLAFAVIWSQLAIGFNQATAANPLYSRLADGCFVVTLQILRTFAQQPYFPLYGSIFASFTGKYLRNTLQYLDEPLRRAEGTQEKARILTLLGSSFRAFGQTERAIAFHQQALDIAQEAGDFPCAIANLNHLSRACAAEKNYPEAINYSQRALILSRQKGDRPGEANALATLGYSEVFRAQQLEYADPEVYESAIDYLQQGLELSEKQGDRQSQALCLSSLGTACLVLEQTEKAIAYLQEAVQSAQFTGDLFLQGSNLSTLAEAHYHQQAVESAITAACLGMYLLEQIGSSRWRQPAGLLSILQGQLGEAQFAEKLGEVRSQLISAIGVDGYDHLPVLLQQYRQG